ncbi:MAG TPA: hypothetical protein VHX59_26105 [Mycobacteriales bacterium]|nr:hypothetical protein [Mycobacteriales bacterium]
MKRVSVVGISGSGKSTLAAALADRLGVPHIELDSLHHQADWTPRPADELRELVAERLDASGWVCDGNYSAVQPIVWAGADTVVWLDLPRRTVMRQVILRTLRRVITRKELWNGNRETWRNAFLEKESIIRWAWTHHPKTRARYAAAIGDPQWTSLDFVRLSSRTEIERFLHTIDRP